MKEMISKIYEVIADKTLSFWCRILSPQLNNYTVIYPLNWYVFVLNGTLPFKEEEVKSIWHPVMIGDVLDWIENIQTILAFHKWEELMYIHRYRKNKRKPIEDQPEDCILFIYNLIKWQEKKN